MCSIRLPGVSYNVTTIISKKKYFFTSVIYANELFMCQVLKTQSILNFKIDKSSEDIARLMLKNKTEEGKPSESICKVFLLKWKLVPYRLRNMFQTVID